MDEPRYAIYFVPPAASDLYRLGAGFLGYDYYTGESLRHPQDIADRVRMGAAHARAAQIRISRDAEGAVSPVAAVHRSGFDGGTRTICRHPPNAARDRT